MFRCNKGGGWAWVRLGKIKCAAICVGLCVGLQLFLFCEGLAFCLSFYYQSSFMVLPNKSFAKDKHQVYYKGKKIKHASAKSFEYLTNSEYGYAKDNLHAYFDNEVILTADPKSFKVLEFPYSCDANDVYCGTLPMRLNPKELAAFKVTNTDKWLKGTKNIMALNHFLELHPQYNWITTLNIEIENVIIGSGGTAETLDKKFIGINETH
jgi:hypothetical protein